MELNSKIEERLNSILNSDGLVFSKELAKSVGVQVEKAVSGNLDLITKPNVEIVQDAKNRLKFVISFWAQSGNNY